MSRVGTIDPSVNGVDGRRRTEARRIRFPSDVIHVISHKCSDLLLEEQVNDFVMNEGKTAADREEEPDNKAAFRQNVQNSALQQFAETNAAVTAKTPKSHEHDKGIDIGKGIPWRVSQRKNCSAKSRLLFEYFIYYDLLSILHFSKESFMPATKTS